MNPNRQPSMARESLPVYNQAGQHVGNIEHHPDSTVWLVKRGLYKGPHMFHRYRGWATDEGHLGLCVRHGAEGMRIHTADGELWVSSLHDWLENGIRLPDEGFGRQVVLPGPFWSITRADGSHQLSLFPEVA